ncbi:MTMRC protein, partial [Pterocles burchelli]|nr:MTMRC protein [Pterocles burchelli]
RGLFPALPPIPQAPGSRAFLPSDYDVALPCIRKLVAASSFTKPKVLTAASTLKFIPEELAVFCRDFRLLRFYFHENGLAPQAFRVANAIAQAREAAAWLGDTGEGQDGWSCAAESPTEDEDEEEEEEEEEGSAATLLFESLRDWEKELKRLGAAGWRVSAVNERFDMAPRYSPDGFWGPQPPPVPHAGVEGGAQREQPPPRGDQGEKILPSGHGSGEKTPRAPGNGTLGRSGSRRWRGRAGWSMSGEGVLGGIFLGCRGDALGTPPHRLAPPEPSDRDLNCLLAALVQLLGDPHSRTLPGFQSLVQREWVAAGHPFPRRLGLLRPDSPREEVRAPPVSPITPSPSLWGDTHASPRQAPVFLLFLDCVWQLVRQFPAAFGFTEAYLLALHDSSFAPYFSTFLFSCQRQRGRG